MNKRERIAHNILILLIGIFAGVALGAAAYLGVFSAKEKEPERENIPISMRESTWASGARW